MMIRIRLVPSSRRLKKVAIPEFTKFPVLEKGEKVAQQPILAYMGVLCSH